MYIVTLNVLNTVVCTVLYSNMKYPVHINNNCNECSNMKCAVHHNVNLYTDMKSTVYSNMKCALHSKCKVLYSNTIYTLDSSNKCKVYNNLKCVIHNSV